MSFAAALANASSPAADADAIAELASEALDAGEEERALPLLERALEHGANARLWQWKGLLERSLDRHDQALASFAEASRLDPFDSSIAHGRARVALEAGVPAEELYEAALSLDPAKGELLTGLAAARLAAGHGEQAERELAAALRQAPLWTQGHLQLAQLRSMLGRANEATESLEEALSIRPQQVELWTALFELHIKREDFQGLSESVESARNKLGAAPLLLTYDAIASAELGNRDRADELFDRLPSIWRIRHLLRSGRAEEALPLIDAELASERAAEAWPYASVAWRLTGDPRSAWLEGDERLASIADIGSDLPPLDQLAAVLRSLHVAKGEYLDQSVRGGTQTDGPLFSRLEPEIRALKAAVVGAVERYVEQLPPVDPKHPLLRHRRDRRIRFSGSWSVRLRSGGRHSNHVHPQGWISSAFYVALPERKENEPEDAGWLKLGEPDEKLGVALPARMKVEPRPGRLVLFPSWMWHGTTPFAEGERLTVAFDVANPR